MDDVLSGPDLEATFLRAPRRGLAPLRKALRGVAPSDAWDRLDFSPAFVASSARRWFQIRRYVEVGDTVRNVRQERIRPVSRHPATTVEACWVAVAAESMWAAEEAGLAFARSFDVVRGDPVREREVVWAFSGVGQNVGLYPVHPSIPGLIELFEEVPRTHVPLLVGALPWVYRTVDWAAAWKLWRGERHADVALIRPLQEVYRLGFGVMAVNDDVLVLQHAPRSGAPTRSRQARRGTGNQLVWALQSRQISQLKRLLVSGADPNTGALFTHLGQSVAPGWRPLPPSEFRAFVLEAARVLLANDYDVQGDCAIGMYHRARTGAPGPEVFVEAGLPPNTVDKTGRTALHEASRVGTMHALEVLLDLGCDPNLADLLGWTPLHVAAASGSQERVDRLVAAGAQTTLRTLTDRMPGDLGDVDGLPRSVPTPPRERPVAEVFGGDDWSVFADWLLEHDDRRGEALQLDAAGQTLARDDVLNASRPTWLPELVAVHPWLGRALHGELVRFAWRCGFITKAVFMNPAEPLWAEMCAALVASSPGQRVEYVWVWGGAALPWRSERLRELIVYGVERDERVDVSGCSSLGSLTLRGRTEDLCLRAPSIRSLKVERPFLRNEVMGSFFATLDAPHLTTLDVTWHHAPDSTELHDLLEMIRMHPAIHSIAIRPASLDAVKAVVKLPRQWSRISLASMRPDVARWLLTESDCVAGVRSLELRVLDLKSTERKVLQDEWANVRAGVVVKGASYRGRGGY